jgi:hypothetical protein
LACESICGSSDGGSVSPGSNASAWFLSTCWASDCVFDVMFTTILSRWPTGIPGRCNAANLGFLTRLKVLFGETFVIMYGPTPGGGLVERLTIGVPAGTSPAEGNAITFANAPYGCVRWIVIRPV